MLLNIVFKKLSMPPIKAFFLTALLILAGTAFAGPRVIVSSSTVEEARINVSTNDDGQSGSLTATLMECDGCEPKSYSFNQESILINQFGAQRPIGELSSWSGNRAMFHYKLSNKHIEQIKILP